MIDTLKQYHNAHKWLIIPWIVIGVAFTPIYFATFTSEPWGYHLHALSAMAWYILIMVQPYLATRGRLKDHRKYGMLGIFIAGAVVFSALAISPTNVYFGAIGGFPPVFSGAFFYGLTFVETLAVLGFALAVIMAIVKSKNSEEHAIWMLSTVFFGMMPGWGRLAMFPIFAFEWEYSQKSTMIVMVAIFLVILFWVAYRLKKLTHPAIIGAAVLNILFVFIEEIRAWPWYQEFITNLFKPTVPWNL